MLTYTIFGFCCCLYSNPLLIREDFGTAHNHPCPSIQMDGPYSSGEELILKARKPYTITKQRERWTEEEHNRFLEALKLYGRAWQRIEEHIGTKTAVQIRSHAQKFFTKLEKEAHVKGTPVGQALDIEIPPPRPKRKPSIPYPRKLVNGHPMPQVDSGNVISGTSVHSVPLTEDAIDLERETLPERPSDEKFESETENQEDNAIGRNCVLHVHHGILSSSVNKNCFPESGARKSCAFKRFVPNLVEEVNSDEVNESYITIEAKDKQYLHKVDMKMAFQENSCTEKSSILGEGDGCYVQENPCHAIDVPVHIVDASMDIDTPHLTPHMEYHDSIMHPSDKAHPKPSMDHSASVNLHMAYHDSIMPAPDDGANPKSFNMDNSSSATCEHRASTSNITFNRPFPGFHHPTLTPFQNHDAYQSFMQASHTFSNLVVSNLLQNPAAHAAACFAAGFWPSCTSACNTGGFPVGANNAPPSVEAIAAATVASATAWWAANGLLPLYPPFQMGLGYSPCAACPVPMARVPDDERRKEGNKDPSSEPKQMKPKVSETGPHLTLRSPTLSLSDTEQSNVLKNSEGLTLIENEQGGVNTEHVDTNKPQGMKQVDRSSCGSNATSGSEVETDVKEKQKKNTEELDVNTLLHHHPAGDPNGRRAKNPGYSSDSYKEVSEEGRLAFRALFSRVTLPQSFSSTSEGKSTIIDVNQQNCNAVDDGNAYRIDESSNRKEDGILISGGKLKGRRTGFKPYKRCSVEAKEGGRGMCVVNNSSSQDQEKGPKRKRLEGQALS